MPGLFHCYPSLLLFANNKNILKLLTLFSVPTREPNRHCILSPAASLEFYFSFLKNCLEHFTYYYIFFPLLQTCSNIVRPFSQTLGCGLLSFMTTSTIPFPPLLPLLAHFPLVCYPYFLPSFLNSRLLFFKGLSCLRADATTTIFS